METSSSPLVEMRDGLGQGHAFQRQLARALPQRYRGFDLPCRRQVVRQQFRFGIFGRGKVFFEHSRDLGVQRPAPSLEQRVVGGILHQGVLEGVDGIGQVAAPERESRFGQLVERAVELGLGVGCDCRNELVAELAPDRRADLRDLFRRWRTIETRRERVS